MSFKFHIDSRAIEAEFKRTKRAFPRDVKACLDDAEKILIAQLDRSIRENFEAPKGGLLKSYKEGIERGGSASMRMTSAAPHARIHNIGGEIEAKNFPNLHWRDAKTGKWYKKPRVTIRRKNYFTIAVERARPLLKRRFGKMRTFGRLKKGPNRG